MTLPTLFDTPARQRQPRGPTALVPAPPRCPRATCARPLVRLPAAIQPALFRHGGYGAAERTILEHCNRCGWVRLVAVETINPHTLTDTEER